MHADPEEDIHSWFRTRNFAEQQNVWVLGAHDCSVGEDIALGKKIEGSVVLNDWKTPLHTYL